MPPWDGVKDLGGGAGGWCSEAPGTAGPIEKPQIGQKIALGGIGPWQPGHILVVQCTQNRLFESISWPQPGHLIIPGKIRLFPSRFCISN